MTKIAISAGHGSKIRGASNVLDEVNEARRVVSRVMEFFRAASVPAEYFFDDVSTTQDQNLKRIVDWHNSRTRNLDVSIHFNESEGGTTDKPIGTECWYMTQKKLADDVATSIAGASGLIDRGPKYSSGLYFLKNTAKPSVLVEIAFVNSRADAELYNAHFDALCEELAGTLAGKGIAPQPQPPVDALFHVEGKCSWFGGPDDDGVAANEGLAFFYKYSDAPHLFLPDQPSGTTGLARRLNPRLHYVACRWDYDQTPKDELANPSVQALVRAHGKEFLAWPADWGPHGDTNRVADLSPGLLEALDLTTDDDVEVIYPAPP